MNRMFAMGMAVSCALTGCMTNEVEYVYLRSENGEDSAEAIVPEIGAAGLGAAELESFDIASVEYSLSTRHRGYLLGGDVDVGDDSGRSFALRPFASGIGHVNVEHTGPWSSVRVYDIGRCSHVSPWEAIATKWVERLASRIVTLPELTNGRRDGIGTITPRLTIDRANDEVTTADTIAIEVPIAADRIKVGGAGCDDFRAKLVASVAPVQNGMDVIEVEANVESALGCSTEETRMIVQDLERSLVQFAASEVYRLVIEDAGRAAGECGPITCTSVPVSVTRFHVRPEGIEAVVAETEQHGLPPSASELCAPLRMPEPNPDVPFPIFVP
jgi:hypothetical protein